MTVVEKHPTKICCGIQSICRIIQCSSMVTAFAVLVDPKNCLSNMLLKQFLGSTSKLFYFQILHVFVFFLHNDYVIPIEDKFLIDAVSNQTYAQVNRKLHVREYYMNVYT